MGLTVRTDTATVVRALAAGGAIILLFAAAIAPIRPAALVAIGGAWVVLAVLRRQEAVAWAAALPVAIGLSWPWVMGSDAALGAIGCTDPLSSVVVRRGIQALAVLLAVAALARAHQSTLLELALRRPRPIELPLAGGGLVVLAASGILAGPLVAEPFFGRIEFEAPAAALVPAVIFGISNGVLEEVAYRGALQGWLTRTIGSPLAIGIQALAFGLVHAGPDVVAFAPIHVTLLALVGLAAGLVVRWTGSLAIPIGIHVGADIALYVGLTCRSPV